MTLNLEVSLSFSIRIVADSKALTFPFCTILYTKVNTLNLALKPLLFLYIVGKRLNLFQFSIFNYDFNSLWITE